MPHKSQGVRCVYAFVERKFATRTDIDAKVAIIIVIQNNIWKGNFCIGETARSSHVREELLHARPHRLRSADPAHDLGRAGAYRVKTSARQKGRVGTIRVGTCFAHQLQLNDKMACGTLLFG